VTLWLARHARPLVAPGICYGALDVAADAALTLTAAQALATGLPQNISVQVSPLKRCQQLADALQTLRPDLQLRTDARLREMDFGHWEGVPWSDIPRAAVDAWTADFAQHRFGGKESANEVLARVGSAWDALPAAQCTLWIAHAGIAQASVLLHQGIRQVVQARDWPPPSLQYGESMVFERVVSPAA
jgi:alpha-ribazole phosphatase